MIFYLLFSVDPPSADIVREDFLVNEANNLVIVGSHYDFKYLKCTVKKKAEYAIARGKILMAGTRTALSKIIVNSEGEIVQEGTGLKGRKQEMALVKSRQLHAQHDTLQELSEEILLNGPVNHQVSRLPKARSEEAKADLKKKLQDLPCFKKGPMKQEILRGTNIFLDCGKVAILRQEYGMDPNKHYQALLKLILAPVKHLDGISATGKRGCVAIPQQILETLTMYTTQVFTGLGGSRNDVKFKPLSKLQNLLSNGKKKASAAAASSSAGERQDEDEEVPEENQLNVPYNPPNTPTASTSTSTPRPTPTPTATATPTASQTTLTTLQTLPPSDHLYYTPPRSQEREIVFDEF